MRPLCGRGQSRQANDSQLGPDSYRNRLIAALISVVIIGVLATIGTNPTSKFNEIAMQLQ
jgi:hypothetical protein